MEARAAACLLLELALRADNLSCFAEATVELLCTSCFVYMKDEVILAERRVL